MLSEIRIHFTFLGLVFGSLCQEYVKKWGGGGEHNYPKSWIYCQYMNLPRPVGVFIAMKGQIAIHM